MAEVGRERPRQGAAWQQHVAVLPPRDRGPPPAPAEPGEAWSVLPAPADWRAPFALPTWMAAMDQLASSPAQGLALVIHLPLCAQRCAYCAHDVIATGDGRTIDRYLDALEIELELAASLLEGRREMLRLHVGGGTPNLLDDAQLGRLAEAIEHHFRWPADAESSIDCDPRRSSRAQLELLRALGFRHLRFGMADLDPGVQSASGRLHSRALVADAVLGAQQSGFDTVALDLVCGLPGQGTARLAATVDALLRIGPDRIRCLRYVHEPARHPGQRAVPCDPDTLAADVDAAFAFAARALQAAGYHALGDGWFVLDDDPWLEGRAARTLLRWQHGYAAGPVAGTLGFGPGRCSEAGDVLGRNEPLRGEWERRLREGRMPVVAAHRRGALETRVHAAIDHLFAYHELPRALLGDGLEAAWDAIGAHAADGWVVRAPDRLWVSPGGCGHLRELARPLAERTVRPRRPA